MRLPDQRRALFRVHKLYPDIVWETTMLEDNPFTLPEVKTLLDGVTIGGHKLSDEQQVLNQHKSLEYMIGMVKKGSFSWDKERFCLLNGLIAYEEALKWGEFRDGPVSIGGTDYIPPPAEQLDGIFAKGLAVLDSVPGDLERALAFFLFGALNQFFYDGNKRTSRLMMNGHLLSHGLDAISIPAKEKLSFNEKMIRFYDLRDGTEMMQFLSGLSLDHRE